MLDLFQYAMFFANKYLLYFRSSWRFVTWAWLGDFFINTPLYLIQQASQKKTFQYLTQSSGAQLAGAGLSALSFNPLASIFQSHSLVFLLYFSLGTIVLPCFLLLKKRRLKLEGGNLYSRKLSFGSTSIPMAMIAILAGIYSGVTLFQQIYAKSRSLNAEIFFLYFTLICVFCRLFLPKLLPREKIRNLVFILLFLLTSSIVIFIFNRGSPFLYIVSTCLFSLGYCFLYSLLHEVALRKKLNVGLNSNQTESA